MKDRRTTISRWLQLITELPRSTKRFIMVVADVVMIPLALYTAITLRLGTVDHDFGSRGWLYVVVLLTSLPVFARLGLYRAVTRYIGARAVLAVFAGVTLSVALVTLLNFTLAHRMVPTSALVIYWALALLYVAGSRYLVRLALQSANGAGERVAIYGAGEAGVRLSVALQSGKEFKPVAFVDDHHALHGSVINGIEVFSPSELPTIIPEFSITRILLAVPSETRRRRREILAHLESLGTHVQTIPDLSDLAAGRARVDEIHEVEVSDLLGRDPVPPNLALLRACIEKKSVLITGAGGSIGSELCRQIVLLAPKRLLLLEMSEIALYNIEKELRLTSAREGLLVEIIALLGNAHHKYRVREIMQTYGVQTVYHAAAYKHMPIVEQNMIEGIHNNVYATWHAAEAALETARRDIRSGFNRQGRQPDECHGGHEALRRAGAAGDAGAGLQTRFLHGSFRQCSGLVRLGGALVSRADPPRRPRYRHASGCDPLFHDDSRSRTARYPGGFDGQGRRCVRARHGQARAHR